MADRAPLAGRFNSVVTRAEAAVSRRRLRRQPPAVGRPPRSDLATGTDTLPAIRHIVVLMMENHSFDNYLGTLGRGDGLALDGSGRPEATNPSGAGAPVRGRHLGPAEQRTGVPSQSWPASHEQWADGRNDGFVRSAEDLDPDGDGAIAMGYWTEQDLPFYHGLARTFPLCDRWFSSCLGPTFPNRRFLVAATARGLTTDRIARTLDYPEHGTIFDQLSAHGISWVDYHPVPHTRPVLARLGGWHGLRAGRWVAGIGRSRVGDAVNPKALLQFTANAFPLGLLRYLGHVRSINRFLSDAAAGALPAVSIVDPDFRQNSEENPQDIQAGEAFAARIVEAVMHGPGWPGTVLIWLYDEHGGYYDHVPPPAATPPDEHPPEDGGPWGYDRYGFRVPAVVVSPFARRDHVSHTVRDHTAVLKLIETKWNLPPLTRRDAEADDLLDCLDLAGPPAFAVPPPLPRPARPELAE